MTATNVYNANIKSIETTTVSSSTTTTAVTLTNTLGKTIDACGTSYTCRTYTIEVNAQMCLSNSSTAVGFVHCFIDYYYASSTLTYMATRDISYSGCITNIVGSVSGTNPRFTVTHSNAWVPGVLVSYLQMFQPRSLIT